MSESLLHFLYGHLEGQKTHARLLFVDFSSAFNTIQPLLLADRLLHHFNLDPNLIGWITDFLTNRSQCVRVNGVFSSVLSSSTGSPQGCCLSPLLFILYTYECRSSFSNRHILKFADDTVMVSLLQEDEKEHGPALDDFVAWCEESSLELNVSKTKDMIIDFRKSPSFAPPTVIKGADVEMVQTYKYLGVVLDNKLCFEPHVDATSKKVQQRLFFLRKMRTFQVSSEMMTLFYRSFIESVLTFCIVAWFGNLNLTNKNRLGSLVKTAGKISGCQQAGVMSIYNRQVLRKANAILTCPNHPLGNEFELSPSGRRFRAPRRRIKRVQVSFIYLLNGS